MNAKLLDTEGVLPGRAALCGSDGAQPSAAALCRSRAESLRASGQHVAANEAEKCALAIETGAPPRPVTDEDVATALCVFNGWDLGGGLFAAALFNAQHFDTTAQRLRQVLEMDRLVKKGPELERH